MRKRELLLICSLLLGLIATGCAPKELPQPTGYFGPTLSLPELAAQINARNKALPTLFVDGIEYYAEIHDPERGDTTTLYDKQGGLQYRAPAEFRMRLNKTVAGNILDIGMNKERFWLIAPEGPKTMWWGNVGKYQSGHKSDIPIRPEDLLQVLAISTMNADLLQTPAPVLRFNNDSDRYMLVWVDRSSDRYVAVREVWYDRETLNPVLVLLFDRDGRIVLRAYLSEPKAIEGAPAAKVARHYDIFFPQTKSKLQLTFQDVKLSKGNAPNDRSFLFPSTDTDLKVKQVDGDSQK